MVQHKVEFVIIVEEVEGAPVPDTYALGMGLVYDGDTHVDHASIEVLQRGYSSPKHALGALRECLTFAPPDLSTYDEGLANLSGLLDRTRDLEEAMTSVGGRLNEAEERLDGMAGPAAPAASRLLPPRQGNAPAARAAAAPVPSIRQARPAVRTVVNAGHGAGGRVLGGAALPITGGVGRPGDMGPTGPGTAVDSDVEIE